MPVLGIWGCHACVHAACKGFLPALTGCEPPELISHLSGHKKEMNCFCLWTNYTSKEHGIPTCHCRKYFSLTLGAGEISSNTLYPQRIMGGKTRKARPQVRRLCLVSKPLNYRKAKRSFDLLRRNSRPDHHQHGLAGLFFTMPWPGERRVCACCNSLRPGTSPADRRGLVRVRTQGTGAEAGGGSQNGAASH